MHTSDPEKKVNKHEDMTNWHKEKRQLSEQWMEVIQHRGEQDDKTGEHGKIKGQEQMRLGHEGTQKETN